MTYILYLLICCAGTIGLIFYGIRAQRKKQEAYEQEEGYRDE